MTIHWSKLTDSTNLDALRNREEASDKTVWAAEYQSAGRGQRGNRWESESGKNLMFSILLKPSELHVKDQFSISAAIAVGVTDYLGGIGLSSTIKWPNDIYVGDKKICGMLIENTLSGDRLSASIAGVGLNLNQREFPAELPNPTSTALELERGGLGEMLPLDPYSELPVLLEHIFAAYDRIGTEKGRQELSEDYISKLYRFGEKQWFEETEYFRKDADTPETPRRFEGIIRGIENDTSRLLVEHPDGSVCSYFFKEIRFLL